MEGEREREKEEKREKRKQKKGKWPYHFLKIQSQISKYLGEKKSIKEV